MTNREQTPTSIRIESNTDRRNNAYRLTHFVMFQSDVQWQELARCKDEDPELFFPSLGENSLKAKEICSRCDVQQQCLDFSVDVVAGTAQNHGVWGGKSEVERRKIKQERYRSLNEEAS